MKKAKNQPRSRSGAVTVEFTLTALLLFTFVFASFEFSRANVIINTIQNAAYEGARRGTVPGATVAECEAAAQNLVDLIDISTSTVDAVLQPDSVTVTVEVPLTQANGYMTPRFYLGRTARASITLARESG